MPMTSLDRYLDLLKNAPGFAENVPYWSRKPAIPAQLLPIPSSIDHQVIALLEAKGIHELYSHQVEAIQQIHAGKNVVISTGTASGKSLCYVVPILEKILQDETASALLFFPTKALENDQVNAFSEFEHLMDETARKKMLAAIYDGDTPSYLRSDIRIAANILLTNPDMLHLGILPHHTSWVNFLRNLKYVVIDEVHIYRGVFGSNVANVLRRLDRILQFYNATPQYILTSATIANPKEHAEKLIGKPVVSVDQDGSPHSQRHFIFFNPPVINAELGVRQGLVSTTLQFSQELLPRKIQTLLFMRSRRAVELVVHDLRKNYNVNHLVRGYRSGYLKSDRREIEHGLKSGEITLAVATNALELGVDIGGVDQVIMAGYPGTITSTLQQAGRAGRKMSESAAVLIASANPLDQFLCQHPEYVLERSPEKALIDPDNPLIMIQHIQCAQFELPFLEYDSFGTLSWQELSQYLEVLEGQGTIIKKANRFFWSSDSYPASAISLRSTATRSIMLQVEENQEKPRLIGEVDYTSSLWMAHPGAVYLHEGETYLVKSLDLEENIAHLEAETPTYFTEPVKSEEIQLINDLDSKKQIGCEIHFGEISVTSKIDSFKKIDWDTHAVLSTEPLDLPPTVLQTMGYWILLEDAVVDKMREEKMWKSDPNDYGPDWDSIRLRVRQRDQYRCRMCGLPETDRPHHVHHKIPFRSFTSPEIANSMDNLITLCPGCHRIAEMNVRIRSAISGLKYILLNLAPLQVMCDENDLGAYADPAAEFTARRPTILIYDAIPAGIGLSKNLFNEHINMLINARDLITHCACQDGCPSCVGPVAENGAGGKKETLFLLNLLLERGEH